MQPVGRMTLNRNPANFFAETEQVAFHTGHLVPGHRRHRRPAAAGPAVLLPRHPAHPARRPELPQLPINRPHAPVNDNLRDGYAAGRPRGRRAVPAEHGRRGLPVPRRADDGGYVHVPARSAGAKVRDEPRVRRPLQPGRACSGAAVAGRAGPHRPTRSPSSSASATSRRSRSASSPCWPMWTPTCARGRRRTRAARPDGQPAGRRQPSPRTVADRPGPGPVAGRKVAVVADDGRGPRRSGRADPALESRARGARRRPLRRHGDRRASGWSSNGPS